MAKHNNKNKNYDNRNNNNNGGEFQISKEIKKIVKIGSDLEKALKKFKKEYGDEYDSKKEIKEAFFMNVLDYLPSALEFVYKFGYIRKPEIEDAKNGIFKILVNDDFLKVLKKEIKNGNEIDNAVYLPIISREIFEAVNKENMRAKESEGADAGLIDISILEDICKMILAKKIKKFIKNEVPEDLAFDLLCVIPDDKILRAKSGAMSFRVHKVFETMYEHAKGKSVPIDRVMKVLVDEEFYPFFMKYALLERKDKYGNLTENQKAFYAEITKWVFNVMEDMDVDTIRSLIYSYVKARKNDAQQGKDGARRYALTTLPETDYKRICAVINNITAKDDTLKGYL